MKTRTGSPRRFGQGFTLVELLVVLAILGLLAGLVGPQVMKFLGSSKTKTAALQIEDLAATLDLYRLEVGRYPNTSEGLGALVSDPGNAPNWNDIISARTPPVGRWTLDLSADSAVAEAIRDEGIEDILFVIAYRGETPEWPE